MAEAVLDAVSYFTDGLCIPTSTLDGIAYFTNGLVLPSAVTSAPGGLGDAQIKRQRFIRNAEEEAEFLRLLIMAIAVIDED